MFSRLWSRGRLIALLEKLWLGTVRGIQSSEQRLEQCAADAKPETALSGTLQRRRDCGKARSCHVARKSDSRRDKLMG